MEVARDICGHPSARPLRGWRSPIDAVLLVVSCVLIAALVPLSFAIRLRFRIAGAARTAPDRKRASV